MGDYDSFFPDASAPPMHDRDVVMDSASPSAAEPTANALPTAPPSSLTYMQSLPRATDNAEPPSLSTYMWSLPCEPAAANTQPDNVESSSHNARFLPYATHVHPFVSSSHAAHTVAPAALLPPPPSVVYAPIDQPSSSSEVPPTPAASSENDPLRDGELVLDVPQTQAIEVRDISGWWTRKFQIVVAHPRVRNRGFLLANVSNCTKVQAKLLAQRLLVDLADTIDGNRMSPAMYQNLLDQPKLCSAYIEAAQAVRPEMPAQAVEPASSSSQAPSASPVTPQAARPTLEEETADTRTHECPICYDVINPVDAVLRCQSTPCHYFHRGCLRTWIQQCQRGNATCPMCRQGLHIHGGRLDDFLNGTASANLSEDERTFLQALLDKIPNRDQWSDVCTLENAQYVGGIVVAAGYGFFRGYNNVHGGSFGLYPLPRHVQVAEVVGFFAGAVVRAAVEFKKDSDNERRRRGT